MYDCNVYKLRTFPVGNMRAGYLKNPVNGSRLKLYVDVVAEGAVDLVVKVAGV